MKKETKKETKKTTKKVVTKKTTAAEDKKAKRAVRRAKVKQHVTKDIGKGYVVLVLFMLLIGCLAGFLLQMETGKFDYLVICPIVGFVIALLVGNFAVAKK